MSYSTSTHQKNNDTLHQNVVKELVTKIKLKNNDERNEKHLFSRDKDENSTFPNVTDTKKTVNFELKEIVFDQGVDNADAMSTAQKEENNMNEVT